MNKNSDGIFVVEEPSLISSSTTAHLSRPIVFQNPGSRLIYSALMIFMRHSSVVVVPASDQSRGDAYPDQSISENNFIEG